MNLVSKKVAQGHVRKGHVLAGFTLIELLVVIAIIGILSSVVLASLNTARNKGNDAAIKSNLAEARAQAELYYDANGNKYDGVCGTTAVNGVKTINASILAGAQGSGVSTVAVNATGSGTTATCNVVAGSGTSAGWAAQVPLKTSGLYCVDSTGSATTTVANTLTSTSDIVCS